MARTLPLSIKPTQSTALPPCCSLLSFQPGGKRDSVMVWNSYQVFEPKRVTLMCCSQCWISYTNCELVCARMYMYVHMYACMHMYCVAHIDMCSHRCVCAYTHVYRCVLLYMHNLWVSVGVSVHVYCVHILCTYMHVYVCMSLKKLWGHTLDFHFTS